MSEVEFTTTSIKGQVVIPQKIREELNIEPGTKFAAFGKNDTIILKKIILPTIDDFENLVKYGKSIKDKIGIKSEKDVVKIIHKARGIK